MVVDSGSQQARDLFAKNYKLETPTQNFQTYSASAPKQIVQQQGGPQLYAQDSAAGTQTYIKSPDQLSGLIGQGYQDTRAPINFQGGGAPAPAAPDMSGGGAGYGAGGSASASTTPSMNPADSFNASVMALLKQNQSGKLDEDLYKDRNELINQRFNTISASPTGSATILSPDQARSTRSQEVSGIADRLGGVDAALRSRAASRDEYSRQLKDTLSMIREQGQQVKDDSAAQNLLRDDARATIKLGWDTYGNDFFSNMSTQEKRDYEKTAGFPAGTLDIASKTLKEETLDLKKAAADKNRYKSIAANKYHENLIFDSQAGKYFDSQGRAFDTSGLPAGSVNAPASSRSSTPRSPTSPTGFTSAQTNTALDAYAAHTGKSIPVNKAQRADIVRQYYASHQLPAGTPGPRGILPWTAKKTTSTSGFQPLTAPVR